MLTPEIVKELRALKNKRDQTAEQARQPEPKAAIRRTNESLARVAAMNYEQALDRHADALLSVAEAAQWILVEERLPEKDNWYYEVTAVLNEGFRDKNVDGTPGVYITSFLNGKFCMDWHTVIAWRPLPAAYQPEEEQKS